LELTCIQIFKERAAEAT